MSTRMVPLPELAKVIRSKNAGPFELTFDVMFDDPAKYELVKRAGVFTHERMAAAFRVPLAHVTVCRAYDPAVAFKITIKRPVGSGDLGDADVYGCQQHVPLVMLQVPVG